MKCPLRTDGLGSFNECYQIKCAWWVQGANDAGTKEKGICAVADIALNGVDAHIQIAPKGKTLTKEIVWDRSKVEDAPVARATNIGNLMTVAEVADLLNVKQDRIYSLAREGILPTIRLARQIRFSRDSLERFINEGGKPLSGGWRKED